jgi:hypothetical protein
VRGSTTLVAAWSAPVQPVRVSAFGPDSLGCFLPPHPHHEILALARPNRGATSGANKSGDAAGIQPLLRAVLVQPGSRRPALAALRAAGEW